MPGFLFCARMVCLRKPFDCWLSRYIYTVCEALYITSLSNTRTPGVLLTQPPRMRVISRAGSASFFKSCISQLR